MRRFWAWAVLFGWMAGQAARGASLPAGSFFADGDRGKKAVALTFDDGPGPFTERVLKILDDEKVKATFFMNGDQVAIRPRIAKEVYLRGHEIGDHTYSHVNFYAYEKKNGAEKAKEKVRSEMDLSRRRIEQATGFTPTLCRMPNGYHRAWLGPVAKEFGYVLVNWTFGEDWLKIPADRLEKDYLAHLKPGAILLMHDGGRGREKTLQILPKVIAEGRRRGLAFVTVSELEPARPLK